MRDVVSRYELEVDHVIVTVSLGVLQHAVAERAGRESAGIAAARGTRALAHARVVLRLNHGRAATMPRA